jgi:hypothetical protein
MFSNRFAAALAAFDEANSEDPNTEPVNGQPQPRELLYARRLYEWVKRLAPDASEALLLAARCQHLRRWEIPRSSFPEGRAGYLQWRAKLSRFHAERSAEILRAVGYDDETIRRVQDINRKKNLAADPEVQTIEDALCLVFLEHQFEDFHARHARAKVIDILRKTWAKMSPRGRAEALRLEYSASARGLIEEALGGA